MKMVAAAVKIGPGATELREFPEPRIGVDSGLLQVAAAGVCGSDCRSYAQPLRRGPHIMGHENVGYITRLGPMARERWGVDEGDYVLLEEYLPCGYCPACRSGAYRLCENTEIHHNPAAMRYGSTPVTVDPGLWGGFSQYLYLHPNSVFHRVPLGVPPEQAALGIPLGNGWEWAVFEGGAGPGKSVLVMGPGQQGLGIVLAAKSAGAGPVIVTGLERDRERLELATALGADATVNVEVEDLGSWVMEITGGRGVDLAFDVAAATESTLYPALGAMAKGGLLLVAAGSRDQTVDRFPVGLLKARYLGVKAVRGHSYRAVEMALATIAAHAVPIERLCSHRFGLHQVDRAIRTARGEEGRGAVHVTVMPEVQS